MVAFLQPGNGTVPDSVKRLHVLSLSSLFAYTIFYARYSAPGDCFLLIICKKVASDKNGY